MIYHMTGSFFPPRWTSTAAGSAAGAARLTGTFAHRASWHREDRDEDETTKEEVVVFPVSLEI